MDPGYLNCKKEIIPCARLARFDEKELARMQEDEEERKARAWDDWKDHNPRGSGNKMANVGSADA